MTILPKTLAALVAGRDDADLLVRLRRRDPEAAGLLYDRYGKMAYSLAFRILGDAHSAEDAVSEAMLKCWNRIGSFRETRGSALGVWLLAATYVSALNNRRPQPAQAAELERRTLFQDWSKSLDTEHVQESFQRLHALDENEKQLLELAFFEGLNPAELTVRLGRPQAEIDRLIASALAKLGSGDQP